MAQRNLANLLHAREGTPAAHNAWLDLQHVLHLAHIPNRVECFDISHTSGTNTLAGCVVFNQQGAQRSSWRVYNIRTVTNDDCGAMREALTRHISALLEKNQPLADLLIIDGGKGQLTQVWQVLKELAISNIALLAIAKGAGRREGLEKLYFIANSTASKCQIASLDLPSSLAGNLLLQIRNSAHKFAIARHRKKRAKATIQSQLQEIDGIGSKRCQLLLEYLGSLKSIKNATIEQLQNIPGISVGLAKKIYVHLPR
jgi:excinuclease ABC subunit C